MKVAVAAAGLTNIRVHDLRHSHVSLLIEMGFNIIAISERIGHKDVSVTLDTYAHLYPGKGREVALVPHNVNSNGLTSGQGTMEAQLLSLMTEIKQSLPATISEYENDDIIVWDYRNKRKNIISFQDLPTMLTLKPDPEAAYNTMLEDGYMELTPDTILCFSKRGMPTQYL
ncbi:tyrosine-type recombinase/integrase [Lacrimispora sp.]|uniref:tyrosine-type recombinase/integrase n=1 Tax=Lacrimispora sp. TaxID=2719234 RepID=UPI003FA5F194